MRWWAAGRSAASITSRVVAPTTWETGSITAMNCAPSRKTRKIKRWTRGSTGSSSPAPRAISARRTGRRTRRAFARSCRSRFCSRWAASAAQATTSPALTPTRRRHPAPLPRHRETDARVPAGYDQHVQPRALGQPEYRHQQLELRARHYAMEHAPLYPVPVAIRVLSRFIAHNRPARAVGAVWAGLLIVLPSSSPHRRRFYESTTVHQTVTATFYAHRRAAGGDARGAYDSDNGPRASALRHAHRQRGRFERGGRGRRDRHHYAQRDGPVARRRDRRERKL